MDYKQLATWLENNQHKFIFYSYAGGTGGEFVCSYLADNLDLYNNTASEFNTPYKKREIDDLWDSKTTNRYNFLDPLLYNSLANGFRKGEDLVQDIEPDTSGESFDDLAKMILTYIKREGYETLDSKLLEDFNNQDKKYLIRLHRILPYMKLFNKSKVYVVKADKWHQYTSLLVEVKSLLAPVYTLSDKMNALRDAHRNYKSNSTIDEHVTYLQPILNEEDIPLYDYTLQVMLNPSVFDIDISSLNIKELQKMLWQLVVYRHLSDKYRIDIHEMLSYLKTYHMDWIEEYNINLVTFEDVFLGTWANTEFDLNKQDFYNSMVRWDQRNSLYLKRLGVKPKRGIRRPNQVLYNDS